LLDYAFVERSWSVRLGAAAFTVSAHISFFFEGPEPRGGGMVVQLAFSFPVATPPAIKEQARQHVRTCLGERYRDRQQQLVAVIRTGKPKQLLSELAHVEQVLGGRAPKRFGPSPRRKDRRLWHVVEALRASSWLVSSLTFTRKLGDERRGLHASIGVIVDATDGRRGIAANVGGWFPQSSKRWRKFRDDTVLRLTAEGFRAAAQEPRFFHLGRWVAGLTGTRASRQADAFDQLLDSGAGLFVSTCASPRVGHRRRSP
jgi:hypothetical protein